MFSPLFWKVAVVRAIKTFAQTLVALLGSNAAGLLSVNWVVALSTAGLAGVMSLLTSVSSVSVDVPGAPAIVDPPVVVPVKPEVPEPTVGPSTPAPVSNGGVPVSIEVPPPADAPDLSDGSNPFGKIK